MIKAQNSFSGGRLCKSGKLAVKSTTSGNMTLLSLHWLWPYTITVEVVFQCHIRLFTSSKNQLDTTFAMLQLNVCST